MEARKAVAIALYFVAAIGALSCLSDLLLILSSLRLNADTGDFAGAGLGFLFLVAGLLPLTLIALVVALWLDPPRKVAGILGAPGPNQDETTTTTSPGHGRRRLILALGLVLAGAAALAAAGIMLANGLEGGRRNYGLRGAPLFGLAIQDLAMISPLIVLAGLLFSIAAAITRRVRRPKS